MSYNELYKLLNEQVVKCDLLAILAGYSLYLDQCIDDQMDCFSWSNNVEEKTLAEKVRQRLYDIQLDVDLCINALSEQTVKNFEKE